MSGRSILRTFIPVDDQWHQRELRGPIVHVASRDRGNVDLWWIQDPTNAVRYRSFRVFGTGHALPPNTEHVGSAVTSDGQLVWHLMERRGS